MTVLTLDQANAVIAAALAQAQALSLRDLWLQ